ncbi:MAG: sigma-70 family RNA polymerase sigma factor [Acidimicrobiia bacterium]|nr:sigma-70 family RNA polymerase sigma factor [Acidimicrobiia bacterium]
MTALDSILADVAAGDRDAFSRFYDETADLVFGIARRVAVDRDLAAEITQEVFLEVWNKARSFNPSRGSARTWVAVMAKRRAIDVVRSVQSARNRDEAQVLPVAVPGDPIGETVIDRDDRNRVVTALAALSDVQREALALAFYGGMTHRAVAERLDVPLGTVKTRIRDGLARLATAMGEADG